MSRRMFTLLVELRCNSFCTFCGQREVDAALVAARTRAGLSIPSTKHGDLRGRYDLAGATAALRQARAQGFDELSLQGGEPTIWPHLVDLVREARSLGFAFIGLVTNGRKLADRDFARRLIEAGLDGMSVSLLGPDAATHDGIALADGAFDALVAGLSNVVELSRGQPKPVKLTATLITTARTLHRLPEQLRLLARCGVTGATLHLVQFDGLAADPKVVADLAFDACELRGALAAARAEAARLGVRLHASEIPPCFLPALDADDLELAVARQAITAHQYEAAAYRFQIGPKPPPPPACAGCLFEQGCPRLEPQYLRGGATYQPITAASMAGDLEAELAALDPAAPKTAARVVELGRGAALVEHLARPPGALRGMRARVREALGDLALLAVQRRDVESLIVAACACLSLHPQREFTPDERFWSAFSAPPARLAALSGAVAAGSRSAGAWRLRLGEGDAWQVGMSGSRGAGDVWTVTRLEPLLVPATTPQDAVLRAFFLAFLCSGLRGAKRIRVDADGLAVDDGGGLKPLWRTIAPDALQVIAVDGGEVREAP